MPDPSEPVVLLLDTPDEEPPLTDEFVEGCVVGSDDGVKPDARYLE